MLTKGHKTMTYTIKLTIDNATYIYDNIDEFNASREAWEPDPYKKDKAMSDVKFFPKLTEAKQKKLWLLHSAIDYLIVTTPVAQNPMTNGGNNSWEWGLIKVGGKEFPAPYKKVGYDWANVEIALEPEYSAAANLIFWLEMLHGYAKNPEMVHPKTRFFCSGAFDWILSLGGNEYHSIMTQLKMKCDEDGAASRVIN
jgi:hypothetical protein